MRTLIAGVLAGLVMFVWSAISHMATPLGTAGLRTIPADQEAQVVTTLKGALNEHVIYFFPGVDMSRTLSEAEQQAYATRYAEGPAGLIVYYPHPGERGSANTLFLVQLGTELVTNIVAGCLGALILLRVTPTIGVLARALLAAAIGLLAAVDIDASYWTWYGFPSAYTIAQFIDHTIGWFLAGLVIAWIGRRGARGLTPASA